MASLVATYFKWKFPLKSKDQCDMISAGVGKHLLGHTAPEPITNIKYKLEKFTEAELEGAYLLDSFRGIKIIEQLLADPKGIKTIITLVTIVTIITNFTNFLHLTIITIITIKTIITIITIKTIKTIKTIITIIKVPPTKTYCRVKST